MRTGEGVLKWVLEQQIEAAAELGRGGWWGDGGVEEAGVCLCPRRYFREQ